MRIKWNKVDILGTPSLECICRIMRGFILRKQFKEHICFKHKGRKDGKTEFAVGVVFVANR